MGKKEESVAAIILDQDKKHLLLLKRRDIPVWVMPGGGLEENEDPIDATLREIKEETGYEAKIIRKVATYIPTNKMTKKTHFYECVILSGKGLLNDETKEIGFFPINTLPYPLPPPYPEWIRDAMQQAPHPLEKPIYSVTYLHLLRHSLFHPILVIRFLLSRIGIHINL
ncbi:MAG: NUDIX hydrolase [Chlamydiales bacterium]|nr:NUDIX hydrolase [Chlamydiales bacterium]